MDPVSQNVPECPISSDAIDGKALQSDDLSERQRSALELILTGQSDVAVARQLGVDRRTIYRWRHDDVAFAAELQTRRRQLWAGVVDRMRSLL
jgi:FixJ family two-component response regulator